MHGETPTAVIAEGGPAVHRRLLQWMASIGPLEDEEWSSVLRPLFLSQPRKGPIRNRPVPGEILSGGFARSKSWTGVIKPSTTGPSNAAVRWGELEWEQPGQFRFPASKRCPIRIGLTWG
jgi:hypothetical protein